MQFIGADSRGVFKKEDGASRWCFISLPPKKHPKPLRVVVQLGPKSEKGTGCPLQELYMIISFGQKKMSLDEVRLAEFFVARAVMIARKRLPSNRWRVRPSKMWINFGLKSTFWRIWIIPTSCAFWKPMKIDAASTLQLNRQTAGCNLAFFW